MKDEVKILKKKTKLEEIKKSLVSLSKKILFNKLLPTSTLLPPQHSLRLYLNHYLPQPSCHLARHFGIVDLSS